VVDVAQAVVAALEAPERFGGCSFELCGPRAWTMRELLEWIAGQTYTAKPLVDVPDFVADKIATFTGWLPGAPLTRDQWLMLQHDNVVSDANGLDAFGIRPTPLEAIAPNYLVRYRKHGRFNTGEQDNRAF